MKFTSLYFIGVDYVRRQAVLCHRVMRTIETIAMESPALLRETWEVLLKFLLAANDSLLSPPSERGMYNVKIKNDLCTICYLFVSLQTISKKLLSSLYNLNCMSYNALLSQF